MKNSNDPDEEQESLMETSDRTSGKGNGLTRRPKGPAFRKRIPLGSLLE